MSRWRAEAEAIRVLIQKDRIEDAVSRLAALPIPQFRDMGILLHGELRRIHADAILDAAGASRPRVDLARRLLQAAALLEAEEDEAAPSAFAPPPVVKAPTPGSGPGKTLEKIITSQRNLRDIVWLARGLAAAKSVCRVRAPSGTGTGFLIAPNVLMTNHHVVGTAADARAARIEFNYQLNASGTDEQVWTYRLDSKSYFRTDADMDFTLVRVGAGGSMPLSNWGVLAPAADDVYPGDSIAIIQHPAGGPKKIAIGTNHVTNVYQHRLQYLTDTREGSSGSPVLDEQWQVVALHHSGGELPTNASGDTRYINEGILLSAIRAAVGGSWPSGA